MFNEVEVVFSEVGVVFSEVEVVLSEVGAVFSEVEYGRCIIISYHIIISGSSCHKVM